MTFKKIDIIDTEMQAEALREALEERGIPHVIKTYHDLAFDGLFAMGHGWGQVDAPEEFREEILAILQDLKRLGDQAEDTPPPP